MLVHINLDIKKMSDTNNNNKIRDTHVTQYILMRRNVLMIYRLSELID